MGAAQAIAQCSQQDGTTKHCQPGQVLKKEANPAAKIVIATSAEKSLISTTCQLAEQATP
jgi:hypothetical protein